MLLVLWAILLYMLYKVLTADKEYTEYDPFEILQLDPVCVCVCVCVCVLVSRANPHPSEEGMGLVTLVKDFSAQVLN